MFDAHCHLDDSRLDATMEAEVARARAAGVRGFVVAGVDPAGWTRQEELARRIPGVVNAFGLHPWVLSESSEEEIARALDELKRGFASGRFSGAAAVGEMGLDWAREGSPEGRARQLDAFRRQLALAHAVGLPVVLHVVRAHAAAQEVVREEGLPAAGGMVHSFHASAELALALRLRFEAADALMVSCG